MRLLVIALLVSGGAYGAWWLSKQPAETSVAPEWFLDHSASGLINAQITASDVDDDGAPDSIDNCLQTPNPNQENDVHPQTFLGDRCEDPDEDGVSDASESSCGSNPDSATARPERIDGIFTGADDDGDTEIDEPLPPHASAFDCDGDGFTGRTERSVFVATDTRADQACVNAWPADINNNGFSDTTDISQLTNDFGDAVPGAAPPRHDIAPDPPNGFVDTADIATMTGLFGQRCPGAF